MVSTVWYLENVMIGFDQYASVAEEVPYYDMVMSLHCGQVQLFSVLETFYFFKACTGTGTVDALKVQSSKTQMQK